MLNDKNYPCILCPLFAILIPAAKKDFIINNKYLLMPFARLKGICHFQR